MILDLFSRKVPKLFGLSAKTQKVFIPPFHPDKANLDLSYSFVHAVVKPGSTTAMHSLTTSEVYYILSGERVMHIDEEKSPEKRINGNLWGDLLFIIIKHNIVQPFLPLTSLRSADSYTVLTENGYRK